MAETNIAYLNNYIGKHTEAAKTLRHYLYNATYLNANEVEKIRTNLADTYIEINKMDSAKVLITEGLTTFKGKDPYKYNQYVSLSVFYNLKLGRFQKAADDANRNKDFFLKNGDIRDISYSLFYLGKAYSGLQQKEKSAEIFVTLDSISKKENYTFPEQREIYTSLIEYYKTKENKEKQLYYIDRFLEIDKKLDTQYWYLSKELQRKYDTPKLLAEKQTIIHNLRIKKYLFYGVIGVLILLLLTTVFLFVKARKAEKRYRKIAQDLIRSVEENEINTYSPANIKAEAKPADVSYSGQFEETEPFTDEETETEPPESNNKTSKPLSREIAEPILEALKKFESKEQYLTQGITLGKLAKNLNTNTSYLSEAINVYKEKNFTSYINDLRIGYALNRLVHDKKFRSYKLPAIAEELGYNGVQAFHIAFKKKTGTTPSIYIKEIEKQTAI